MNILGIQLSNNKPIYTELLKLYGIGTSISKHICKTIGTFSAPIITLTTTQQCTIKLLLKPYIIELPLRTLIKSNITRLITIKCYRGIRHLKGLPVRGQRTRTNAKTIRKLSVYKPK